MIPAVTGDRARDLLRELADVLPQETEDGDSETGPEA